MSQMQEGYPMLPTFLVAIVGQVTQFQCLAIAVEYVVAQ